MATASYTSLTDEPLRMNIGEIPVPSTGIGFYGSFAAGLVWGLGTAFSFLTAADLMASIIQSSAMAVAALFTCLAKPSAVVTWLRSSVGFLLVCHVVIAAISGVLNESMPLAVVRYLFLLPTIAVIVSIVRSGQRAVAGVRAGLTIACLAFVFYCLAAVDRSQLTNPNYRISLFLGANSIAFVSAMCGVSLLDYAVRRIAKKRPVSLVALLNGAGLALCLILCVATKSRTGTAALLFGLIVRLYLWLGFGRSLVISIVGALVAVTIASQFVSTIASGLADTYQFSDRMRGLAGGTGRFAAWTTIVTDIWLPNFFLGAGPGSSSELCASIARISGPHNGILLSLIETGFLGTLPLLTIVAVCISRAVRHRHNTMVSFAVSIFAAGMVEATGETMFFSMGNPGSLLFMLSIAVLSLSHKEQCDPLPRPFLDVVDPAGSY